MKHLVLFLSLFISIHTHAALTPLEEQYIEQLQSGRYPELKTVAKAIQKSDVRNTEVLDIAAEILLQAYTTATSAELEPASLLARALGQSKNRRYYSALEEVHENCSSEKLSRHVSIAISQLKKAEGEQYTRGMVTLAPPKPSTETEKGLIKMIKSGDDKQIQDVSKYIIYSNIYRPDFFDAAAEVLANIYPKTDDEDSTSASLLVRLISYSYSNKYEQLFRDIHQNTENEVFQELLEKSFRHVKILSDKY